MSDLISNAGGFGDWREHGGMSRREGDRPKWRLLRSGAGSPAWNMAADEAILEAVGAGAAPPTVRFFGWNPPTLSIGYFQKAETEIELNRLAELGIGFVRRPTGGRAVLHDQELTYSIIVPEGYEGLPVSVTEAYRVLSEGLRCGFEQLGLPAEMVVLEEKRADSVGVEGMSHATAVTGGDGTGAAAMAVPSASTGKLSSSACFDSPSWYELVVGGRKVAGSAQVRHKGAVLQHGSILLELDADRLFSLLRYRTEELRSRLAASFVQKAAAINPLLAAMGKPPIGYAEAEAAFIRGMEDGLGVELHEGVLSEAEHASAQELAAGKYGSSEWNLRR